MSSGKSGGQARSEIETTGSGRAAAISSSAADVARSDRRSHLRDERLRGGEIETLALVVDRCRTHPGFDQLDPPTVHDLVVGRRRDRDRPAEVIEDAQTHGPKYSVRRSAAS